MAEELQQLLEKIQREGVEKSNAQGAALVAKAKADAAALLKDAEEKAAALRAAAEKDAAAFAERAAETVRQAARDTVLEVQGGVTRLLEKLLAANVNAALAEPAEAAKLALDAVRELAVGGAELHCAPAMVDALKAQLAAEAKNGINVVADPAIGAGFSVRLDGGRVEHDFTGKAVADALARRLRPDLAALVQG